MSQISRRLRFEIFRRDDHACRYCGARAPEARLTVDHVVPVALGGDDEPTNLVTACADCNAGKSSVPAGAPLVEAVADDALRWSAAMQQAAATQAAARGRREAYVAAANAAWLEWTYGDGVHFPRPDSWPDSFEHFHDVGLELDIIVGAIDKAMRKRSIRGQYGEWNYMCGICWRTLDERQQLAHQTLGEVHNGE